MSTPDADSENRWAKFRAAMAAGPQNVDGPPVEVAGMGVPFRRTPGEWLPNRVFQEIITAGWNIWEVIDRLHADVRYYENARYEDGWQFDRASYALGFINAAVSIARANRDPQTEGE